MTLLHRNSWWVVAHRTLALAVRSRAGSKICALISATSVDRSELERIIAELPSSYEVQRVLDHFCLVLSITDIRQRQETLDGFFEWLGADYETHIDLPRNLENLSHLIELLAVRPPANVVDFGCGPGLGSEIIKAQGFSVLGVDSCPIMRALAERRGVETLAPSELERADITVDGILASYVFHFIPDLNSLVACWQRLRVGHRFAANFHKGIGVERVVNALTSVSGMVLSRGECEGFERHGIYVQIEKSA